jgi:hypothetical protein
MIETKTTSARSGSDQFRHVMKSIGGLLLCLMLVGCASDGPQASVSPAPDKARKAADKQAREDIMEAVFRQMCQPEPVEKDLSRPVNQDHKVYFLSINFWYNPSAELLKRLNNLGAPVKPITAGEWRGDFIYDRMTGERGAAFYIERITVLSDDEADVDAVIRPGGPKSARGWFYRLHRKDGRWVVARETWKWMS